MVATTTNIVGDPSRLRGFTLTILELLNDCGALSAFDLKSRTGKTTKYINRYLYNLRDKGYIARNNNFKYYLINALDDSIIYIIYKEERKKKERRKKEETLTNVSSLYKNEKITKTNSNKKIFNKNNFELWKKGRDDLEIVVVVFLEKHWNGTDQKFILAKDDNDLAGMLGIGYPESKGISDAILKLTSDGAIYCIPINGVKKIGLKNPFIRRMQADS